MFCNAIVVTVLWKRYRQLVFRGFRDAFTVILSKDSKSSEGGLGFNNHFLNVQMVDSKVPSLPCFTGCVNHTYPTNKPTWAGKWLSFSTLVYILTINIFIHKGIRAYPASLWGPRLKPENVLKKNISTWKGVIGHHPPQTETKSVLNWVHSGFLSFLNSYTVLPF